MSPCEIVFFDAGGTLLRPEPSVGEVYARAGRRHGVVVSAKEIETSFFRAFRAKKGECIPQGEAWWRDVVLRAFAPFGGAQEPEALFDELYAHFAEPGAWRLFPEVHETLDALAARGIRTGLLSNWDERLLDLLAGLGIRDRLDPAVVSCDVGFEKPDARIFEAALRAAGVAPERAVMIGDEPEADVLGARAVGMDAVLVDRRNRGAEIVPTVTGLTELVGLLDRGEIGRKSA